MSKNWSRIALASFLVLALGATVASATTSRVNSLASAGDYMSDDSAVNRWYSTLTSFANQVNAEMGTWNGFGLDDTRGLGWTHACGDDGKWGTYRISLNEASLSHPGFWIGNPFYQVHSPFDFNLGDPTPNGDFADTPLNRWDIAGGWELGETMALGVAITQSKWRYEDTGAGEEASNSWLTLGAGFTWTNNDDMILDILANFGMAGGESTDGTDTVEWDANSAFDIGARLFWDWKDDVTLVPVAEFTSSDYSLQSSVDGVPAVPNGQKTTDFMLGIGLNMDVNQDNMLIFAMEYFSRKFEDSNSDTTSVDETFTTLPTFRLALESHITSWLTTRVGAIKYLVNYKAEYNGGDYSVGAGAPTVYGPPVPSFIWTLGCGFNVAEWTIDMELASETPFNLGYWLTGYSNYDTAGGPVGRISAVYNY
jgi:hypothetical protein